MQNTRDQCGEHSALKMSAVCLVRDCLPSPWLVRGAKWTPRNRGLRGAFSLIGA
jgi:hypothetical protein